MKRDLDLVRTILLAVEALPPDPPLEFLHIPNCDDEVVMHHLTMMADAELVTVENTTTLAQLEIYPTGLTWKGADVLDAVREDKQWRQAKAYASQVGATTFNAFVSAVVAWATTRLAG